MNDGLTPQDMKLLIQQRLTESFGSPTHNTDKLAGWDLRHGFAVAVQLDTPKEADGRYGLLWLPFFGDERQVGYFGEIYDAGRGRHSNTYRYSGMESGKPVVRYRIETAEQLDSMLNIIHALLKYTSLPEIAVPSPKPELRNNHGEQTKTAKNRDAIPKLVQREVWRRDQGRCVECGSKERLEFDHIIPVSKGGSNTTRNIQLLCELCNRSKGGRI